MKSAQKTIVLLGPMGSFSDQASEASLFNKYFKKRNCKKRFVLSIPQIFKHIKGGNTYGLVPIKNKIVGEIPVAARELKKKKWKIIGRHRMPVNFVLAARPSRSEAKQLMPLIGATFRRNVPLSEIKKLYVSEIAKKQCGKFIKTHLSHAEIFSNFASTSLAYKKVVQLGGGEAYTSGAIGSEFGAKIYKLKILARKIQDDPHDWTEFVLFARPH